MALIICKECGGKLSDKATVCPHCGAPVDISIKKTCPECGAEVDNDLEKCPECGCPMPKEQVISSAQEAPGVQETTQTPLTPQPDSEEPKKGSSTKWVLIVAVIVAIMVAAYTHCTSNSRNSDSESSDSTNVEQVEENESKDTGSESGSESGFHSKDDVMTVIKSHSIETPAGDVKVEDNGDVSSNGDKIGNITVDEFSAEKAKATLKINVPVMGEMEIHVEVTPDGVTTK